MFKIMVVEDDKATRGLFCAILNQNGYETIPAVDGVDAMELFDKQHVDLILLDLMLPRMDGYTLTKQLREAGFTLPILMVTAKQLPEEKKHGFKVGTDDYMTKPVDEEEMLLRIKALLRRARMVNEHRLNVGHTVLDFDNMTVTSNEEVITLPRKEFQLLYKLLSYPGKIFTRIQLMDEIWGMESETSDMTVNVHINRLRKHFENNDDFEIVTVRGLGYKAVNKNE